MTSYGLLEEKLQSLGQASGWRIKKGKITARDLLQHEIRTLEQRINDVPEWEYESPLLEEEVAVLWKKDQKLTRNYEKFSLDVAWVNFNLLKKDLFSKPISDLDKQLGIVYLFLLMNTPEKELSTWFIFERIPFAIKADLEMTKFFQSTFYPGKTMEEVFKLLHSHVLGIEISKKLRLISYVYILKIMPLEQQYNRSFKNTGSNLVNISQENAQLMDVTKKKPSLPKKG